MYIQILTCTLESTQTLQTSTKEYVFQCKIMLVTEVIDIIMLTLSE